MYSTSSPRIYSSGIYYISNEVMLKDLAHRLSFVFLSSQDFWICFHRSYFYFEDKFTSRSLLSWHMSLEFLAYLQTTHILIPLTLVDISIILKSMSSTNLHVFLRYFWKGSSKWISLSKVGLVELLNFYQHYKLCFLMRICFKKKRGGSIAKTSLNESVHWPWPFFLNTFPPYDTC